MNREIEQQGQQFKVAVHEWGHRLVGRARGAIVHVTSIIPEGNTLGYNIITPDRSKPRSQQFLDSLVSFFGGEAAEEAIGHTDHRGCGSDLFQAWRQAELLSKFFYRGNVAAAEIISWGRSTARSIVNNYGVSHLKDRALSLVERKVVF